MCLGAIGVIREVFEENGLPMARRGRRPGARGVPAVRPGRPPGDHVLVELGFAVETLEPEEAAEALRMRGTPPAESGRSHEGQ